VNHLFRELAPITDTAWTQIEEEATRSLRHFLAGRKLLDVSGPHGWHRSSVDLDRIAHLDTAPVPGTEAALRVVAPLMEVRTPFTLQMSELAAADRGAEDLDLDAVVEAARTAALAEDTMIFHGYEGAGVLGLSQASPHEPVSISDNYDEYPSHVAKAVATLRAAGVDGPFAIALGSRCYTGVVETTEHGGYPVFEHIRMILGGPIVWAPAVNGAVVLSQRGDDLEVVIGEDFAIGYRSTQGDDIQLYLEESIALRINSPEAAIALTYPD
jgi:uncharacterized linocin/CFP29 family protein